MGFGQDKMELKDKYSDKSVAVIRRARMSFRDTFYIYTVEKPYPEAEYSNEDLDGAKLYCWGYLSTASGWNCIEDYEVGAYYWDKESKEDPKSATHPYKPCTFSDAGLRASTLQRFLAFSRMLTVG